METVTAAGITTDITGRTVIEAIEMKKGDEVIEREETMIEGIEKMTAAAAVEEDEGEVAEAEEVTDISLNVGIEKREMAVAMIEEICPQVK